MLRLAGSTFLAFCLLVGHGMALEVGCDFNPDRSSLLVTASNSENTAYRCLVQCRLNLEGQRAFERFSCEFNLQAGAESRIVCERKGDRPHFFTAVSAPQMTCVPRN